MKNFRKIAFTILKAGSVILSAFLCITCTEQVKTAVSSAIMRCLTTVIPSLYGMLIISSLIIRSGILMRMPRFISFIGKLLFGMEPDTFAVFLFGMIAGYPTGARMLSDMTANGQLAKKRAEIFSGLCFGAGPAFIFGCISTQLYSSSSAGMLILLSSVSANIILALLISPVMRRECRPHISHTGIRLSFDTLNECILTSGRSMYCICATICAFSVLTALLAESGLIGTAARCICRFTELEYNSSFSVICTLFDVTNALSLPHNNYRLLPVICALVSFGGICVIMQIYAVTGGKMKVMPLVFFRMAAAVISYIICRSAMPFFIDDVILSASGISVCVHSSASPLPSLILILMTLILFRDYDRIRRI